MDLSFSDVEGDLGTFEVTTSPSREELVPLLKCPVCYNLPLPPIRTCTQGHIICAECCPKLSGCPLCRSSISYGRNFFAEEYVNKSIIQCKYQLDGCLTLMSGAIAKDHMKKCMFRPIECTRCQKYVCFRDIENHLQDEHQVSRWDINEDGCIIMQEAKRHFKTVRKSESGSFYAFLFKSLFAAITLSFIIDQFIGVMGD